MQAPRQSNHTPSSVEVEVVQDDRGGDGLRTLQLHSYIPQTRKGKKQRIEKLTVDDLKDKTVAEIARAYLRACEKKINNRELNDRELELRDFLGGKDIPTEKKTQDAKKIAWTKSNESKPKLYPVKIGEVRRLAYKGLPVTQEVVFGYKCGEYPVYGASARIELTEKSELLSATIISPADIESFTTYDSSKPIRSLQDILAIALEKAGYPPKLSPNITEELRKEYLLKKEYPNIPKELLEKDYPIKWYFDPSKEIWRAAYIIDNIPPKLEDKDRLREKEVKQSTRWGMIKLPAYNYAIDAYEPLHFSTEI